MPTNNRKHKLHVLQTSLTTVILLMAGCVTPPPPPQPQPPKPISTLRRGPIEPLEAIEILRKDLELKTKPIERRDLSNAVFVSSRAPRTSTTKIGVPSDKIDLHPYYRIPAIIRGAHGRLLAFSEGRYEEYSDTGKVDIVFKVSDDDGKTWSRPKVIVADKSYDSALHGLDNTCGNPAPVFDPITGRIWLLWTWNRGDISEPQMTSTAKNPENSRLPYAIYSDDNGNTWRGKNGAFVAESGRKNAIDLSDSCKDPSWAWFATGPGAGIATKDGNLLVGANFHSVHSDVDTWGAVLLKYDRSKSAWVKSGIPAPLGYGTNETSIAELNDGSILLNCRHHKELPRVRVMHITTDLGHTWRDNYYDKKLIDPQCQGSMLSVPVGSSVDFNRLLFANLHTVDTDGRRRSGLGIRLSYDDGKSWLGAFRLRDSVQEHSHDLLRRPIVPRRINDRSGYSSMVLLSNGRIGVLYEGNAVYPDGSDTGQFGAIMFDVFSLQEIIRTIPAERHAP